MNPESRGPPGRGRTRFTPVAHPPPVASSSRSSSRQPPGILKFAPHPHQPLPPSTIHTLPQAFGTVWTPGTELPEGLIHFPAGPSSSLPPPARPALYSTPTKDSLLDNIDYSRPLSAVVLNRNLMATQTSLETPSEMERRLGHQYSHQALPLTPEVEAELEDLGMEDHVNFDVRPAHSVAQTPVVEGADPLASAAQAMRVSPQFPSDTSTGSSKASLPIDQVTQPPPNVGTFGRHHDRGSDVQEQEG